MNPSNPPVRRFLGILTKKERWGLSRRGWLLLAAMAVLLGVLFILGIHPFLAPVQRVNSRVLVVEGWVRPFAIKAATQEYAAGGYDRIYTTGGPASGQYVDDFQTTAHFGAGRLQASGVPAAAVQRVPSKVSSRDRTYSAAVALREWFRDHGVEVKSMNVLTQDVHARRTRLLYQMAFGEGVEIGIIGVPNPDYDAGRWWRYSEGAKEVLGESIAWFYAKFCFYP